MRKLVLFPGDFDCPFAKNEFVFYKNYFDEVIVLGYPSKSYMKEQLEEEYQFSTYIVGNNSFYYLLKPSFYRWFFSKDVLAEIKKNIKVSLKGFKKITYMIYYGLFYLESAKLLDKLLESDAEIYLYSFWLSRPAYAVAMYQKAGKHKDKIKFTLSRAHGFDVYLERNAINYLPFRDFLNQNLDEISFISEHGRAYFTKVFAKNEERFSKKTVSHLGTFNNIGTTETNKADLIIATCSNIIEVKRLDLIIDVLSDLKLPFKWYHIGEGNLKEEIMQKALNLLPENSFEFLGKIENNKILSLYKKLGVNIFLNLSDSEGLPVSIMEAMSCGIPCIGRDVGGISEIINNKNGLLLPKNENVKQYRDNLIKFLKIIRKDNHVREEAFNTWNESYNANKIYPDFLNHFVKNST